MTDKLTDGRVAQSGERPTFNRQVPGSTPGAPTISDEKLAEWEALAKAVEDADAAVMKAADDYEAGSVELNAALAAWRAGGAEYRRFNNPAFALSAIAEIHRLRGERDEAVRHLRACGDLRHEPARAFLAKLELDQ